MALIICPDCGGKVSDKAKACIHCGCPLEAPDFEAKIKMPVRKEGRKFGLDINVYDDDTNELIAKTCYDSVINVMIDKPRNLRFEGDAIKPVFHFEPKNKARYALIFSNSGWWKGKYEIAEIDNVDAD